MSRGKTQEDGGGQEIPAQISKQTTLTSGERGRRTGDYKYSVKRI